MVSGEQPSDRICHKIEILSFPSLSERGPFLGLRERGFFIEKGGSERGRNNLKMGGEGPESPHFIDGKFLSPFLSSQPLSPRLCYGKGQRKDLTSKQSLDFSLIRTGLAIK